MHILENHDLSYLNTFGLSAKAKYYTEVSNPDDLKEVLSSTIFKTNEHLILGGGSNVLFTSDFDGLVIKMCLEGIEKIKENEYHIWLKVGAGVVWHKLVLHSIDLGLSGIENLSLIPGTVGAAPMQNIGAYGVEIESVFESLEALEKSSKQIKTFNKEACAFGYRESVFKKDQRNKYIITNVILKLNKQHQYNTSYGAIQKTLEAMQISELSPRAVSDAVIQIRQSKLPDPAKIGNAGSFFKNPVVDKIDFEGLKAEFPEIPGYEVGQTKMKVPAGWLIEQCGWRGKRKGDIGVHEKTSTGIGKLWKRKRRGFKKPRL